VARRWMTLIAGVLSLVLMAGFDVGVANADPILPAPPPSAPHPDGAHRSRHHQHLAHNDNILGSQIIAAPNPGGDSPGANHFDCKPSRTHPHPVVLVHGIIVNKNSSWQTVSPILANHGYCVFALTYGVRQGSPYPANQVGGIDRLKVSARELRDFVAKVKTATGATTVDIVAHSEGTFITQIYLRNLAGAATVDKVVDISGFAEGTLGEAGPLVEALRASGQYDRTDAALNDSAGPFLDFSKDSKFVHRLNDHPGGPVIPGVTYTTLVTRYDELVVPYTDGLLPPGPHVTNIVTQHGCEIDFSEHGAILSTRRTGQIVLNALDPDHTKQPPCDPVLPLQGSDNVPLIPIGPGH
jgi:triacylglycerol lipase